MRKQYTTPNDVRFALEAHYKKWGFTAFRDECHFTIEEEDDGDYLAIEFANEWSRRNGIGGKVVHIPDYENALREWIAEECRMQDVESLTEEEARKAEDDMNREHIMVMYEKAVNAAMYHEE